MTTQDERETSVQVVHVIVERGAGLDCQVLLLRRFNTGRADGTWDCPAGRFERGESLSQAAARELVEEVGLVATNFRLIGTTEQMGVLHYFVEPASWTGHAENLEPDRSDGLGWWPGVALPEPMQPFVRQAISRRRRGPTHLEPDC